MTWPGCFLLSGKRQLLIVYYAILQLAPDLDVIPSE